MPLALVCPRLATGQGDARLSTMTIRNHGRRPRNRNRNSNQVLVGSRAGLLPSRGPSMMRGMAATWKPLPRGPAVPEALASIGRSHRTSPRRRGCSKAVSRARVRASSRQQVGHRPARQRKRRAAGAPGVERSRSGGGAHPPSHGPGRFRPSRGPGVVWVAGRIRKRRGGAESVSEVYGQNLAPLSVVGAP